MSDLPRDDAPGSPGRPDAAATPADPWTPATDAGGAAGDAARPAKSGAAERGGADDPSASAAVPEPQADAAAPVQPTETPPGDRIAKAMARAGIASRRDAEAMILAGRVSVNGETLTSPARNVTDDDRILVDGQPMPARERSRLWIFHKPRGLVTTARDPEGRQTVFEVLPEDMPRVVAVGRLDINTEGLLLLTNDGGLAKVIAHPDTGWLRRYRVRAHGDTDQAQLDRLAKGITIEGMEYGPIEATLDRVQGENLWLTLGLREGKNREVKRILEHLGLAVNRLIRLSFGPFQLGDLEVGLVEEVRMRVLKDQLGKGLAAQAGVDFESPVREPIAPFGGPARREPKAAASQAPPGRTGRNAARPAPPPRVATGGTGSGPRRSAWRAPEEDAAPRPARVPRRGADPRASRASAAERGRERVGSIRAGAGERRVVVERLGATPAEPVPEEAPRRRYADRGAAGRPPRSPDGRPDRGASGERAPSPRDGGSGDRAGFREGARPPRAPAAPRGGARPDERRGGQPPGRRDRPSDGARTEGAPRGTGGSRDRTPAPTGGKPSFDGAKPRAGGFRDGPRPGRAGGKPGGPWGKGAGGGGPGGGGPGGRGPGGKGAGGKSAGGKPGGFRGGSKPGGGRPPRGGR